MVIIIITVINIIIIFLEASIKSVYLSNISPTWYMDISDPLKYDQILKFSLSASQWSQRALKREYLPSMYVNSRRKSKLPSTYRYIDKTHINYYLYQLPIGLYHQV